MTKTKLVFKSFDPSDQGQIRCANKNESANLKTEGVGMVKVKLENGRTLKIDNVILAESLSDNLLSLRKFADLGLGIYLDNQSINILDPKSKELLLSGIYDKPFWIIQLEVGGDDLEKVSNKNARKNENQDTEVLKNDRNHEKGVKELSNSELSNEEAESTINDEKEGKITESIPYFETTICDRTIFNIDELPTDEVSLEKHFEYSEY